MTLKAVVSKEEIQVCAESILLQSGFALTKEGKENLEDHFASFRLQALTDVYAEGSWLAADFLETWAFAIRRSELKKAIPT